MSNAEASAAVDRQTAKRPGIVPLRPAYVYRGYVYQGETRRGDYPTRTPAIGNRNRVCGLSGIESAM